jgi:hypothetical protein
MKVFPMLATIHVPVEAAIEAPAELWAAASLLVGWLGIVVFLLCLASRARVLSDKLDDDEEPRR